MALKTSGERRCGRCWDWRPRRCWRSWPETRLVVAAGGGADRGELARGGVRGRGRGRDVAGRGGSGRPAGPAACWSRVTRPARSRRRRRRSTPCAIGLRGLVCRLRLTRAAAARALGEGDPAEAAHAALAEAAMLGLRPLVVEGLDLVAALTSDVERAGRLAGAAAALREELGAVPSGLVELVPPDEEGARLGWERAVEYPVRPGASGASPVGVGEPHADGGRGRRARGAGPVQRRDRRAAAGQPGHRAHAPAQRLRQAGRDEPGGAGRAGRAPGACSAAPRRPGPVALSRLAAGRPAR